MSDAKKWMVELQQRYGVHPDLCRSLRPVVEDLSARGLTPPERRVAIEAIALACRSQTSVGLASDSIDEVRLLVGQFIHELKKMDESLKVLTVYLDRVRQQIKRPPSTRIIH